MLRDAARNAAYRTAIEAAAPGRVVLDIGTGSGLLAMIAARAGAARVIACEANPLVAEAARRIIAANGLAEVITIHACHSSALKRSAIGEAGADLVMSEIFSANLVGEGVLNALDHARAELTAPGALFLPEAASLRVALAELEGLEPPPANVAGFVLGDFARLFRPTGSVEASCAGLALRSPPGDLVRFDWSGTDPVPVTGTAAIDLRATGGPANIIAQWLQIDFGGGVTYENAPFSPTTEHWPIQYTQLPAPLTTSAGTRHAVHAFYHADALALWAE
jgi:type II protein arginine methyltransferase